MSYDSTLEVLQERLEGFGDTSAYTPKMLLLQEALIDDLTYRGIEDADDLLNFYVNVAIASYSGDIRLDRSVENFQFGFSDLEDILEAISDLKENRDYSGSIRTQLKVKDLRSKSLAEMTGDEISTMFAEDLTTVRASLGIDVTGAKVDESLVNSLKSGVSSRSQAEQKALDSERIQAIKQTAVDIVLETYDIAFEAGFEMSAYQAVLMDLKAKGRNGSTRSLKTLSYDSSTGRIAPMSSTASVIFATDVVASLVGIEVSSSRQLDLERILKSKKPVYHPYKILEFAFPLSVSYKEKERNFSKSKPVWRGAEGAKRGQIEDYLNKVFDDYICLATSLNGLAEDDFFLYEDEVMSIELSDTYQELIDKLVDSLCTFAILKESTGSSELWASADWVVSAPPLNLSDRGIDTQSRTYTDVFGRGGIIAEPIRDSVKGRVEILQYTHVANATLAEATPLFAYKAFEALKRRGERLSYRKLLLGRGIDKRILLSGEGQRLNLAETLILDLFSGSRSGKGVTTASVMATAVLDAIPIFGADRKPDTLVPYFQSFNGFNGGRTPAGYFVQGAQIGKGDAEARPEIVQELMYDENPHVQERVNRVPKYMSASGQGLSGYTDTMRGGIKFGDFVYLRHILLTMGILLTRSVFKSSPTVLSKLGGTNGIFVLHDEVSNLMTAVNEALTGANGMFSTENTFINGDNGNYSVHYFNKIKDLDLKTKLTANDEVAKATFAKLFEEENLGELQYRLYTRDLYENIRKSTSAMSQNKKAGLLGKGSEAERSTVFIVGQTLDIPYSGSSFLMNKSEGLSAKAKGTDPLMGYLIYELSPSLMVGYNKDKPDYGWVSSNPLAQAKLSEISRYFAFYKDANIDMVTQGDRTLSENADDHASAQPNKAVYFKPFLTLPTSERKEGDGGAVRTMEANLQKAGVLKEVLHENASPTNPNDWHEGIGISGYLKLISGEGIDISASFVKASDIANTVVKQLGYHGDWMDFLMDASPEWNFSAETIVNAFKFSGTPAEFHASEMKNSYYSRFMAYNPNQSQRTVIGENPTTSSFVSVQDDVVDLNDSLGIVTDTKPTVIEEDFSSDIDEGIDTLKAVPSSESILEGQLPDYLGSVENDEATGELPSDDFNIEVPLDTSKPSIPIATEQAVATLASALGIENSALMKALQLIAKPNIVNNGLGESSTSESASSKADDFNQRPTLSRLERYANRAVVLNGYYEARDYITRDMLVTIDGITSEGTVAEDLLGHRLRQVDIIGGQIYLNRQRYAPKSFGDVSFNGLPSDMEVRLRNKEFAYFFDWRAYFSNLSGLRSFSIDSREYAVYEVAEPIGIRIADENSILKFFTKFPTLDTLQIADLTYERSDLEQSVLQWKRSNQAFSRRQAIFERAGKSGRDFTTSQWRRARENMKNGNGISAFGNVLGAGAGLVGQGASKTASSANSFLRGARRFTQLVADDLRKSNK